MAWKVWLKKIKWKEETGACFFKSTFREERVWIMGGYKQHPALMSSREEETG